MIFSKSMSPNEMSSISFISYSCVTLVSILFGLIYLTKNQFMPYHATTLGWSWSELAENMQVLILALMRATGGGFIENKSA